MTTGIVTPSDDILIDGTNLYSFTASSAVSGGALVKVGGDYTVIHSVASVDNSIGVALYETATGELVSVAGPGCIVRCCAASGITKSSDVFAALYGKVDATQTYGGTSPCIGIALETVAADAAIRVLLK